VAVKRPLVSAPEVLAACDAALALTRPGVVPVAAFDADHTLWHADVGDLAWHALLDGRLIRKEAAPAIAAELALVSTPSSGEVHEDARRLYALYKEDRGVSELSIVRAMTVCYAGWTVAEVRELARRLSKEVLSRARYEGVVEIARGLKERGLRVVVVSGSPTWLVAEGVRGVLPVDADADVFGAEVEIAAGVLGTTMRDPVTFFEGKVESLKALLPGKRPSFAFGDSKGDVPLLHHAGRAAFAVNPRPALRKLAEEHEGFHVFAPARTVGGELVRAPGTDRVIE
jgi:HAD superfamily phosphoserine phosphatase-like hydrolase